MGENQRYYSVAELAEMFQVDQKTIVRHMRTGKMPAFKVGGQWRMSQIQLDQYIESTSNGKDQA